MSQPQPQLSANEVSFLRQFVRERTAALPINDLVTVLRDEDRVSERAAVQSADRSSRKATLWATLIGTHGLTAPYAEVLLESLGLTHVDLSKVLVEIAGARDAERYQQQAIEELRAIRDRVEGPLATLRARCIAIYGEGYEKLVSQGDLEAPFEFGEDTGVCETEVASLKLLCDAVTQAAVGMVNASLRARGAGADSLSDVQRRLGHLIDNRLERRGLESRRIAS